MRDMGQTRAGRELCFLEFYDEIRVTAEKNLSTALARRPAPDAGRNNCLQIAVDEGGELALGYGTDLGGFDLAVLEQHQCRDAADAVLGRRLRVLVDVQFGDLDLAGVFARDFLEHRADHLAGTAPLRPEIHQYRTRCLEYILIERCIRNVTDTAHGEASPALGWGGPYGPECAVSLSGIVPLMQENAPS